MSRHMRTTVLLIICLASLPACFGMGTVNLYTCSDPVPGHKDSNGDPDPCFYRSQRSGFPPCTGAEGGVEGIPVCPGRLTSEFTGTIDGEPYDTKNSGDVTAVSPPEIHINMLSLRLAGPGSLNVSWGGLHECCEWFSVDGELVLPEGGDVRGVRIGSQLMVSCEGDQFLYRLVVDGGNLNGCSR